MRFLRGNADFRGFRAESWVSRFVQKCNKNTVGGGGLIPDVQTLSERIEQQAKERATKPLSNLSHRKLFLSILAPIF